MVYAGQGQVDGTLHYLVLAKLAILNKQFKQAEAILLERVSKKAKKPRMTSW
jgi:hypothetical protein